MEQNSAESIRAFAAREYIQSARQKGLKRIQIRVGDVHRALRLKNRVPNVCSALTSKIFLQKNHLAIEKVSAPPSGVGTRVIYTYRLLDQDIEMLTSTAPEFENLRGLLKGAFDSCGGGEAFLRRERSRFYQRDDQEKQ